MNRYPVKAKVRAVKLAAPATADVTSMRRVKSASFDFRYSYASISLAGGKAHLKARRAKSANGTLESESFEADVDPALFERAILESQRQFARQAALFWQPFASWLPLRRRSDDVD